MDKATLYKKDIFDTAVNSGLKCQVKKYVSGGNNAGAIHLSKSGVPTITLSLPTRYIHSPSSLADLSDLEAMLPLARHLLKELAKG
jgi:endoglucanase